MRIGSGFNNEELHSMYRSPNIVRVIKSRRLRWAGHIARMEDGKSSFTILTGKPTVLGVNGRNSKMGLREIGINTRN